jgi:hypothetical protein
VRRGAAILLAVAACTSPGKVSSLSAPDASVGDSSFFRPGDAAAIAPASDGGPTCAEQAYMAAPVPADLLLLVDNSSSMRWPSPVRHRYRMVNDALSAFIRDPRSAGLGLGIQFFPRPGPLCDGDADCHGSSRSCVRPGICGQSSSPGFSPSTCGGGATCGTGDSCTRYGHCAVSSAECTNLGQRCPGADPSDICSDPPGICQGNDAGEADCSADIYRDPYVPIAELPAAGAGLLRALFAPLPAGATPMGPAVDGALAYLTARQAMNPGHRLALIIATDGIPEGCAGDAAFWVARKLAQVSARTPSLQTFVIGAVEPGDGTGPAALAQLAQGGGTGKPFLVEVGAHLSQDFLSALERVRGALPCELDVAASTSGPVDLGKVNVHFSGRQGEQDVLYVGSAARCDPIRGGWYYDADPATGATPARIIACPTTCALFRDGTAGRVELRYGCKTRVIE